MIETTHHPSRPLTDFSEGQNADLSEGFFDVFRDGDERSQHRLRERYPACSRRVIRRPQFGTYLDDCSDEFNDLFLLDSELIVP